MRTYAAPLSLRDLWNSHPLYYDPIFRRLFVIADPLIQLGLSYFRALWISQFLSFFPFSAVLLTPSLLFCLLVIGGHAAISLHRRLFSRLPPPFFSTPTTRRLCVTWSTLFVFSPLISSPFLHYLALVKDPSNDQIRDGAPASPHTVLNIRLTKKTLVDGGRVAVRKGLETVVIKQCPDDHKRCAVDGLPLSVVTEEGGGHLASLSDQGQTVYIIREGHARPNYASAREYRIVANGHSPSTYPEIMGAIVRKRTTLALMAGFSTIITQ